MKKNIRTSRLFLAIGKTMESTEAQEFKRYIGLGSSKVLAVNPSKKELDALMGYESASEPEYVVDTDNGKEVRITFIVRTDPETCNGIEITNRAMITLRNTPAYNRDQTKVQVIDRFGNTTYIPVEDAKAGKPIVTVNGNPAKIDTKYRMACVGEADLVSFLKAYLNVGEAYNYTNGSWILKENAEDFVFSLEHIKDYFSGDFSELKEALALQPNNKVKLLYGVRTNDEGKQYQAVCTSNDMVLRNNAGARALEHLEKQLAASKQAGKWASTDYRVQELQEFSVEPTNLNSGVLTDTTEDTTVDNPDAMPWD